MKKIIITLLALMAVGTASVSAQNPLKELNIFQHLGLSAHVGSTGIGFEVATPITDFVDMRVGATFMPGIKFNTTADFSYDVNGERRVATTDISASLARPQGSVIFNVYPFARRNSFFVAAGAYFGGSTIVKLNGSVQDWDQIKADIQRAENAGIDLGEYVIPVDEYGNAQGGISVNKFRPYFGIGYGRPLPKKRLSFMVELGVQIHGHGKIWYKDLDGKEVNANKLLDDNNDDWQKVMDKLTVYPVLKFTLAGRLF